MKTLSPSNVRFRTGLVATIVAISLASMAAASTPGPRALGANRIGQPPGPPAPPAVRAVTTTTGTLPDGATWIIQTPEAWNGTLLLFEHGLVPPGQPNPSSSQTTTGAGPSGGVGSGTGGSPRKP